MPPKSRFAPVAGLFGRLSDDAELLRTARMTKPRMPIVGTEVSDTLNPAHQMRMSEALGNAGAEGKTLNLTQADRSRVFGPNKGGIGFSGLQLYSPPHHEASAVWGYGKKGNATKAINRNKSDSIWSTFLGAEDQHMSNPVTVKRMLEELLGNNPSPALISKINAKLPQGLDIRDPNIMDYFNTFEARKRLAELAMTGGEKMGEPAALAARKVIAEEMDPLTVGHPTFAVGPRLFELNGQYMYRPDLNSAFPDIVGGTDYGMHFEPVPARISLPDYHKKIAERKDKSDKRANDVSHWDMDRANPTQFISEDYLNHGKAEGGPIHMGGGGTPKGGGMAILEAVAKLKREADQARKIRNLTEPIPKPDVFVTGMQPVLPPAIREANKAIFMAKSADPDRYYHGTRSNIKAFHPKTSKAVFLTKEPDFAGSFATEQDMLDVANDVPSKNPNQIRDSNIMPLRVQTENPFDPDNVAHMRAFQMKLHELIKENPKNPHLVELHNTYDSLMDKSNSYNTDNTWHFIEKPAVQDLIKELGHDAFYVTEGGHKNLGVYDPRKIKSDIGNRGTYDTMSHDVNESHGGAIHGQ